MNDLLPIITSCKRSISFRFVVIFILSLTLSASLSAQIEITKTAHRDTEDIAIDTLKAGEEFTYKISISISENLVDDLVIEDIVSEYLEPVDVSDKPDIQPDISINEGVFNNNYENPEGTPYINPLENGNLKFTQKGPIPAGSSTQIFIRMKVKEEYFGNLCPPGVDLINTVTASSATAQGSFEVSDVHTMPVESDFLYAMKNTAKGCILSNDATLYEIEFKRTTNGVGNVSIENFWLEDLVVPTNDACSYTFNAAWLQIGGVTPLTECTITGNRITPNLPPDYIYENDSNHATLRFYIEVKYNNCPVGTTIENNATLHYQVPTCSELFMTDPITRVDNVIIDCPGGDTFLKTTRTLKVSEKEGQCFESRYVAGLAKGTFTSCCRVNQELLYESKILRTNLVIIDTFPEEVDVDYLRWHLSGASNEFTIEILKSDNIWYDVSKKEDKSDAVDYGENQNICNPEQKEAEAAKAIRITVGRVWPDTPLKLTISGLIKPDGATAPSQIIENCAYAYKGTSPQEFQTTCASFETGDEDAILLMGLKDTRYMPSKVIINERNSYFPSDQITYRIAFGNQKTRDIEGLTVTDQLLSFGISNARFNLVENSIRYAFFDADWKNIVPDGGITYSNTIPSELGTGSTVDLPTLGITGNNNTLTWNFEKFPSDCSLNMLFIEYTVEIDPDSEPGEICNGYSLFSADDKWPYNGPKEITSTCNTVVLGAAQLIATKEITPPNPAPGTRAKYTITFSNEGKVGIKDIELLDILPYQSDRLIFNANVPRGTTCEGALQLSVAPEFTPTPAQIEYTNSTQPDLAWIGRTDIIGDPNWGSTATSDTKGFRAFLGPQILPPNQKRSISFFVDIPEAAEEECLVCNTIAFRGYRADDDTPLLAAELDTACFKIGPPCATPTICGRIDVLPSAGISQDAANTSRYTICSNTAVNLMADTSFTDCSPTWEYSFDQESWTSLGSFNSQQSTGILPNANFPIGVSSIFYRVSCLPTESECCQSNILEISIQEEIAKPLISGASLTCEEAATVLSISNSDSEVTYEWFANNEVVGMDNTQTITSSGCYQVVASNACGTKSSEYFCTKTCVFQPVISCDSATNGCTETGEPITLNGCETLATCTTDQLTYTWLIDGEPHSTTDCMLTFTPANPATNIVLEVVDEITGCQASSSIYMVKICGD